MDFRLGGISKLIVKSCEEAFAIAGLGWNIN